MRRRIAVLLALLAAMAVAQDDFTSGEQLILRDRPAEAVGYLEASIRADPSREKAYLYLGLAYMQLGKPDEAISVLKRGSVRASEYPHLFAYNLGNCYFAQGKNSFAEDMYTQALAADPNYAPAYLNRANARLRLDRAAEAASDYETYLRLEPATPQREAIERVLGLIRVGIEAAELKKAEEARRLAEEEARRSRLMADVAESLRQAAEETLSLSAGAEGSQGYEAESELAD
jgi:tetratricopeptide (TPR) repeat protein